jgi:hypothetical protein
VIIQKLTSNKTEYNTKYTCTEMNPSYRHEECDDIAYKRHHHPNKWVLKILNHNNLGFKKVIHKLINTTPHITKNEPIVNLIFKDRNHISHPLTQIIE